MRLPRSPHRGISLAPLVLVSITLALTCDRAPRPNVVVITVDTLRADQLGAYGNTESPTPHLDAFAREATIFTHAVAPMPLTRPSHFSMLTSRYPREHGVLNNATSLPATAQSVAEDFLAAGYRTAAFVGVTLLGPDSGAAQGFSTFDLPGEGRQRPAEQVVTRALEWIGRTPRSESFFLWLHLFDPHIPYAPPKEFRSGGPDAIPEIDLAVLEAIAAEHDGDIPQETLDRARALYRGEVAYIDHWFGRFLSGLQKQVELDRTVVVFTADHGECFENGIYFEHADCLYQPALHIPLMVRFPRQFRSGDRVGTQTGIIDVAPTLLQAADLEIPSQYSGSALQDVEPNHERYLLIQYPFFQQRAARSRPRQRERIRSVAGQPTADIVLDEERVGLVGRDWKYIRGATSETLLRLSPEPNEASNLSTSQIDTRNRMRSLLDQELEAHPLAIIAPSEINDELRATLEALGYLQN